MSTLNRGRLLKLAREGKLVCVSSYHFDDMTGESRLKEPKPVRIKAGYGDFKEGFVNLFESDFRSGSGSARLGDDCMTAHLYVHSNCSYDFRMADGSSFKPLKTPLAHAQRPENKRMADFLAANGIVAVPKYLPDGSLRGCWRLYNLEVKWSDDLAAKLNALGFTDFDGEPLGKYSGNGGMFSVFVRGHNELLKEPDPEALHQQAVELGQRMMQEQIDAMTPRSSAPSGYSLE